MTHGDDGDTTPKATTMKASAAKAKATGAADDGAGGGDGDEPTPTMPKLPRSRRAGGRAQRRASAPTIDPGQRQRAVEAVNQAHVQVFANQVRGNASVLGAKPNRHYSNVRRLHHL